MDGSGAIASFETEVAASMDIVLVETPPLGAPVKKCVTPRGV